MTRDIYRSELWRTLDVVDRAQLLLVMEGVKRGCIIECSHEGVVRAAEEAQLSYAIDPGNASIFEVAHYRDLFEQERLFRRAKSVEDMDTIAGWFLSYPACCTERFVLKGSARADIQRGPAEPLKQDETYRTCLDYRVPGFIPCSPYCDQAHEVLQQWGKVLRECDEEAAEGLAAYNRRTNSSWPTGHESESIGDN